MRRQPLVALLIMLSVTTGLRASLESEVRIQIRSIDLRGATVAVSVLEAGTGSSLVSIREDRPMIPASNMKLLTTGAALHTLGGDFRFRTQLTRSGDDLVVLGDGDPAFGDPVLLSLMTSPEGRPLDVEAFLAIWVDAVVATGTDRIARVVVDDRVLDREFVHPTWPRDQLNLRYCAQVSGLNFHLNQLHFYPRPHPGGRPSVDLWDPHTEAVTSSNSATSDTGVGADNTMWIARPPGRNRLTFYGNAKHDYRVPVTVTAHDMPRLFAGILAERLRNKGIAVDAIHVSETTDPEPDPEATPIGPPIETPIATVVTRCNRDSQNLYAESLIKRMGYAVTRQPGSWLNGGSILRHVAHERIGRADLVSTLIVSDGSGLSRDNRLSAALMTNWLNSFHNDERLGPIFIDSFAVSGESGTLRKRLRPRDLPPGTVVRAKTGFINGVSCLSGYVTGSNGARRCFSILINDLGAPVGLAKELQNRIVRRIAEDLAEVTVTLGGGDDDASD